MFRATRKGVLRGFLLLAGALLLVVIPKSGAEPASAQRAADSGIVCTKGTTAGTMTTFNLKTATGRISMPDGNSVYMWGYANADGDFQMPGPTLCVKQGQTVRINLTNHLPEAASIVFPGQTGVTSSGGTPGLLAAEAAANGGTVSYSFVTKEPGTYLYESGSNPHKQVPMGLYGALTVRPTKGDNFAYNHDSTRFNPAREYMLLFHEIDPLLHEAVEAGRPYDVTTFHPRYWTINGRAFPDTIAPNHDPSLPSQPYGAMVTTEPYDSSKNPLPALVRYLNAGMHNHPMHPHGNHVRLFAEDGRLMLGPGGEDLSYQKFTQTIGAGQTFDGIFLWTDLEKWSPSNPIPVTIPNEKNMFVEDMTFYSGSPYLGYKDDVQVGPMMMNECGEYYFIAHSHAAYEMTNWDAGMGGMLTFFRVDPPGGCQNTVP